MFIRMARMAIWSRKVRRSGYPETVRHEVIKTSYDRWEKMCGEEDGGGRPVIRPRGWRSQEGRQEKERKASFLVPG